MSPAGAKKAKRIPTTAVDYHANTAMYSSQATTWASAVANLRKLSGEAYEAHRDSDARLLRGLADDWEPRIQEARDRQQAYQAEYFPEGDNDA
jgi:hypothetical protein